MKLLLVILLVICILALTAFAIYYPIIKHGDKDDSTIP